MKHIVFRVDADASMGTGHLMRCVALAQALRERGSRVSFLTACRHPALLDRIRAAEAEIVGCDAIPGSADDAQATLGLAKRCDAEWIVLDGYHFDGNFQQSLRQGLRLLAIDDYGHCTQYTADLVLNQNLHARTELYRQRDERTELLLGPRYALLRREFWAWHGWKRKVSETGRKVLVTLGGSDPTNITGKVIEGLQQVRVEGLEVVVVIGPANPHREQLKQLIASAKIRITLRCNVENMAELMAWADLAVAAGGTTTWERAALQLPSLIFVIAENQREVAVSAEQAGIAVELLEATSDVDVTAVGETVEWLLKDRVLREQMAVGCRRVCDGMGAHRVASMLESHGVQLCAAKLNDCRLIWEWANDPTIRAASFHPEPIPWEEHQQWFGRRLRDPDYAIFIVKNRCDETPVGQIRFERKGYDATISIALDKRFRGRGYGSAVIRRGTDEAFRLWPIHRVLAYVREENRASQRAFEKAGYRRLAKENMAGQIAEVLVVHQGDS